MKQKIATITGAFLAPGVSKNGRLYTQEAIGRAVSRMNERIASGGRPINSYPVHPKTGEPDTTSIVSRVTKVWQDDKGVARWEAEVPDTSAGRDLAALISPEKPYLENVSIRGRWVGEPKTIESNGTQVETADDLEVFGIDFTTSPGVSAAKIDSVTLESLPEGAFTENAWEVSIGETVKLPISKRLGEKKIVECYDPSASTFNVNVSQGPLSISVSAYDGIDDDQLAGVAQAALAAALQALDALDPDQNSSAPDESHQEVVMAEEKSTAPAGLTAEQVQAIVAESVKAALEASKVAEASKTTETPTTESKTTEAAPDLATIVKDAVATAVKETTDAVRKEMVETYGAPRKGFNPDFVTETEKPLHEMSRNSQEFQKLRLEHAEAVLPS
ncbi:MAG: hypothetical protein ACYDCC_04810 [Actinomycetota bacterium]